jgi:hypothetical protein
LTEAEIAISRLSLFHSARTQRAAQLDDGIGVLSHQRDFPRQRPPSPRKRAEPRESI